MGVVTVLVNDVAETQKVQLFLTPVTRRIDREKDRPGNQTSEEADRRANFEVTK